MVRLDPGAEFDPAEFTESLSDEVRGHRVSYAVKEERTEVHVGASGASVTYVLDLFGQGVAGVVAAEAWNWGRRWWIQRRATQLPGRSPSQGEDMIDANLGLKHDVAVCLGLRANDVEVIELSTDTRARVKSRDGDEFIVMSGEDFTLRVVRADDN